ncbi:GATA-type zinc finger protein 1 GATA-like protein 1 [Channa argus]|uniref:GATA-type zinc finger protein 1 GATA-like protein 1 n=1 Tax=Channa argus TaxID=215402 RepID=A0A6G1PBD4_CHAAH|nr:GATA-type zinc finger protein 1 GATA-like protein 1 [Channa argus]
MSTGPRPQAAFIQGNQSMVEQDASHSALFYLFQEVSKLSSSTRSVTNSNSVWLNDRSRPDNCIVKKEKDGAFSFQTCQHSLSLMSAYSHINGVNDESPSSDITTLVEPHHDCNSTWKVLTLINLQCERLMHRRDEEDAVSSSVSSVTKLPKGQPTAKLLTTDVTEQDIRSDSVSTEYALRPSTLRYEIREITASVSPVEDVRKECSQSVSKYKPQCCAKHSEGGCSVQPETVKKTDVEIPKLVEEIAAASSEPQHRDKKEIKFNVTKELVWSQECETESFSSNRDNFNVSLAEKSLFQTHMPNASQIPHLSFDSTELASVALSKPTLTLDYNANIALPIESPCDMQHPPPSSILPSALLFSTPDCHSFPKQENRIISLECAHAPTEEESPPAVQAESYKVPRTTSKCDPMEVQTEISSSSIQQWRTKTPRKQPHPSRSVDIQDPDLQGVTFRMDTEVDDNMEQCRLLITSKYSKEFCKSVRKPKLRSRTSQKSLKTSSSEEESDLTTNASKDKVCASCCTRKTPMWRDAEDGTPLCNACGIRYKKYRVRCVKCWHIPKKEGNSNSCCLKCGNFVRLASAQRKHTS